jgi:hypothetical protein
MKFAGYTGLIMGALFVTFGILIPFFPPPRFADWGINNGLEYIVGLTLVMYGIFRITRAYKLLKSKS